LPANETIQLTFKWQRLPNMPRFCCGQHDMQLSPTEKYNITVDRSIDRYIYLYSAYKSKQ